MSSMWWYRASAAALLTVGAIACSSDASGPEPTDDEVELTDVAAVAGDAAANDVALLVAWPEPTREADRIVQRSVTFYDAAGAPQGAYDPLTTASASIEVSIQGELVRPDWSASVMREWQIALTGLIGTEETRTVNGTGHGSFESMHQSPDGARTYQLVHDATLTDVLVPVAPPRWPLSGTLTRSVEVTRTGPRGEITRSRTVTITFDGTREPRLDVDGLRFILDLATGLTRRAD